MATMEEQLTVDNMEEQLTVDDKEQPTKLTYLPKSKAIPFCSNSTSAKTLVSNQLLQKTSQVQQTHFSAAE